MDEHAEHAEHEHEGTATTTEPITGTAAGVPFLAVPPSTPATSATPVVLVWHLLDAPRTEAAMYAALPLDGLDAWRVYLGLPLSGSRLPEGGVDEIMRLGSEDAVMNLYGPITAQALDELPGAYAALREQLGLGDGPVGLLGGSQGAAVAQLVLAEGVLAASAAVLVNPVVQLRPLVDTIASQLGFTYPWADDAVEVARRHDLVARAGEVALHQPAVQIVLGSADDQVAILDPALELRGALVERYDDPARVELVTVEGMAHALADEPGIEAAPQTAHAAEVDRHAVRWFRQHLR